MSKFSDTLNPEDVKLLLMARDQILACPPERFDMTDWAGKRPRNYGTAFCLCGHMAVLDQPRIAKLGVSKALVAVNRWRCSREFAMNEIDAWWKLFSYRRWPTKFICAGDPVSILSERIDHWLETGL